MSEQNLHKFEAASSRGIKFKAWVDRFSKYFAFAGAGVGVVALTLAILLALGVVTPVNKAASVPCPTYSDSTGNTNGVVNLDKISAYGLWLASGHDGTLQDFFDALVGQPGADGYIGSDGVNGTAGSDGKNGADGPSAYQLWLDAGNSGSETDFLRALVGPAGEPGATGAPGAPGIDG
ncbi:MAG: collagen-like protein, partial [Micrococcales bacterium]